MHRVDQMNTLGTALLKQAFVGATTLTALWQTLPQTDYDALPRLERLSAQGILFAVCIVLWRKLESREALRDAERKEAHEEAMKQQKAMLEAMDANTQATKKLGDTVDALKIAVNGIK